jgi:hypothetical protein
VRRSLTLLLLFCGTTVFADGEVRVHIFTEPASEVYLGQRTDLIIEVRTDSWFTTAPKYPELKLPGAITLMPDSFGVNTTTREGGITWAGQRRRYVVFPQRPGELIVPPIELSLAVATNGKAGAITKAVTPPITISVAVPPGSETVASFLTSESYRIQERWDGDSDNLQVGDAITRTITQTADGVFALVLPTVAFLPIDGLAVYPTTPELSDKTNRGQYSATRVDSVTYVLEEEGDFTLPPVETHWFDIRSGTMRSETLESLNIAVLTNPDALLGIAEEQAPVASKGAAETIRKLLNWLETNVALLTAVAAIILALHWLWGNVISAWIRQRRNERERFKLSEDAFYQKLNAAVASRDPDRFVKSFWLWSDRLPNRGVPLSTDSLSESADTSDFITTWRDLDEARYHLNDSKRQRAAMTSLNKSIRRLRTSWLQRASRAKNGQSREVTLDRLNP